MTYGCSDDPQQDIIEVSMRGAASTAELVEVIHYLAEFCKQHTSVRGIIDYSELDVSRLTMDEIGSLSNLTVVLEAAFANRKCAHVVAKDIQFGLVRAWEIMIGIKGFTNLDNMIFRNKEEAYAWLNGSA